MRSAQRLLRELCPRMYSVSSYSVCRSWHISSRNMCTSKTSGNIVDVSTHVRSIQLLLYRNISYTTSKHGPWKMPGQWGQITKELNVSNVRHMAGHSHWKNIKHIKEAKDAAKSELNNQQLKLMAQIMKAGGADPKKNSKLAAHIDRVIKLGVPKTTVLRFLEKYEKHADQMETFYAEVRGPAGVVIVAELQSPHQLKSMEEMRSLIKKTGGQVQKQLSWQHIFYQKGVVTVPVTPELLSQTMDHFFEVAIETGAEDVILIKNDKPESEAESLLKFHCSPKNITTVAKAIEDVYDLEVISKEIDLTPHMWVNIDNEADIELCQKILARIEAHPDVTNVFDNISVPEE